MDSSSTQDALLFIPDISGFTQFVNDTEISHSQHIIEELLEVIIDANNSGLVMAEIEGDAILFFRQGTPPTAAELLSQVQRMFINFHAHLKKYESHRICQCGACSSANSLSLKFFCHYGEVSLNRVKDISKPFGRNVILIHRLMKNNIPGTEYTLFTKDLSNVCSDWVTLTQVAWAPLVTGEEEYDAGTVQFDYLPLAPLMGHVPNPAPVDYSIPGATDLIMQYEHMIEAPMDIVFDVVCDFDYRPQWQPGLIGAKNSNKIAQSGMSHRCIIKNNENDPSFIIHGFDLKRDLITFVETNHRQGHAGVYFLRRLGQGLTKVEAKFYIKPNAVKKLIFNMFIKKKLLSALATQFKNLNAYCKQLVSEGRSHSSHIELSLEHTA